jgi:hypothetical protein
LPAANHEKTPGDVQQRKKKSHAGTGLGRSDGGLHLHDRELEIVSCEEDIELEDGSLQLDEADVVCSLGSR